MGRRNIACCAWVALVAGICLALSAPAQAQPGLRAAEQVALGREVFVEDCAQCHGYEATGVPGRAPSLIGAGAASAHFYLSTGRMPLEAPWVEPERSRPRYPPPVIAALVAYVASLGAGPPIPDLDPAEGDLGEGLRGFFEFCAGCHQAAAQGGPVPPVLAPGLAPSTPLQIAEAVRVGPGAMPPFGPEVIDDERLESIVRYVRFLDEEAPNPGGAPLWFLGPVPEGALAWLLGGAAVLLLARLATGRAR